MNTKLKVNQTLIFNFLEHCKDGIVVTQKLSEKVTSTIIIDKFNFCYDQDKLEIFNEEQGIEIMVFKLSDSNITEHDNYIVILKYDFSIRIEEKF